LRRQAHHAGRMTEFAARKAGPLAL
jgi:hypothetical protein